MTGIRYKTLGCLTAVLAGLLFLVAARVPELGFRQTGGIAGRITYAMFPSDESFEPTDAVV